MVTREELLKAIENEIYYIPVYKVDPIYEYSKDMFMNGRVTNPVDFANMDVWKWFEVLCYNALKQELEILKDRSIITAEENAANEEDAFEKCIEILEFTRELSPRIKPIIDVLNTRQFVNFMAETLKHPSKAKKLVNKISPMNSSGNKLVELFGSDMSEVFKGDACLELKASLIELINFICNHLDAASESLKVFVHYKATNEIINQLSTDIPELGRLLNKNKTINRVFNIRGAIIELLKNNVGTDYEMDVVEPFTKMQEWCNGVYKFLIEKQKKNDRKKNILSRTYALIENVKEGEEINNPREFVKGLDEDSEIKKTILQWIYEHNKKIYDSLSIEYKELSNDNINQYRAILSKYMISINDGDIIIISRSIKLESLETVIKFLKARSLSNEEIITVLKTTNMSIFNRIVDYLNSGFFNSDFIKTNIDLFNSKGKKLSKYTKMVEFLQSHQVNPALFNKCPNVLLNDYSIISSNILVLEEYGLLQSLKTSEDLFFVIYPDLREKIDLFIELGLIDVLQNNIRLLNYSTKEIKRLILVYMINGYTFFDEDKVPLMDWESLFELVESKGFFMDDETVDESIVNPVQYANRVELNIELESLKKDMYDPRITIIGGSIFSTKKIERMLNKGSSIYDAIFYNKICSDTEYERVMGELKQYQKK